MGLDCVWDMLDVQWVVFVVYNLFGVDLGCLFKLWPVKNCGKTSFGQKLKGRSRPVFYRYRPAQVSGFSQEQQHAGRDLHFTGRDLCRVFCV